MFKKLLNLPTQIRSFLDAMSRQAESQQRIEQVVNLLVQHQHRFEIQLAEKSTTPAEMVLFNPHFNRNFIPNDDSAIQKNLIATWQLMGLKTLGYKDLAESGFRAFSQNDEDGILLRLFTHIGCTNRYVVEIGSNCSGSEVGIPENLSTNLIVNHGWHGTVFEMDQVECEKMLYFFARDYATKHYHWNRGNQNTYYSPMVVQQAISPENINTVLVEANIGNTPDLFIIDIDGGDYSIMQSMITLKPRVVVVEFEKRFRDRYSVVQLDRTNFSRRWQQSGSVSLPAWEKLLGFRGYSLCAVGSCGFNAFFVRSDVALEKLTTTTAAEAFNSHPVLSSLQEEFWLVPDETWEQV